MEGAATTVYAQGGRGNARLVAWEGERTVTFTMEDALISAEGFMILSGAGLIEASSTKPVYQHVTETVDKKYIDFDNNAGTILVSKVPYLDDKSEDFCYVMFVKDGEVLTEPYIASSYTAFESNNEYTDEGYVGYVTIQAIGVDDRGTAYEVANAPSAVDYDSAIVDYYVEKTGSVKQIEITADKFGGNYYLEASTLFRTQDGVDLPAEFIIPNCKIQSNFTFSMASSGDPSTFTFTMDAFPDYTRFDHSKKVLAAIQIIEESLNEDDIRTQTDANGVLNYTAKS